MSRATYDRIVADWAAVAEAVRKACGEEIVMPARHLELISHGYQQLQTERAAALALVAEWERKGIVSTDNAAEMCRALGVGESR